MEERGILRLHPAPSLGVGRRHGERDGKNNFLPRRRGPVCILSESGEAFTTSQQQHSRRRRVPDIHSLRFVIKWLRFGCGEAASVSKELAWLDTHYKLRVFLFISLSVGDDDMDGVSWGLFSSYDPSSCASDETGRDSKRSSMRSAAGASLISLRSDRSTPSSPPTKHQRPDTNSIRRRAAQREDQITGGRW